MLRAIKNIVATVIAAFVFALATVVALGLISVFTGMWYVFFGTPVFGDFLGVTGFQGRAAPPTTGTLVFVAAMGLISVAGCVLMYLRWNEWRRRILKKRRNWLKHT